MRMETFALADHSLQPKRRSDLNDMETFKTRLVRVDLARRDGPRDILRHCFRKVLRHIWFFIRQKSSMAHRSETYDSVAVLEANLKQSYQNTARIAKCLTRFVVAILAGAFWWCRWLSYHRSPDVELSLLLCRPAFSSFVFLFRLFQKRLMSRL